MGVDEGDVVEGGYGDWGTAWGLGLAEEVDFVGGGKGLAGFGEGVFAVTVFVMAEVVVFGLVMVFTTVLMRQWGLVEESHFGLTRHSNCRDLLSG